ncbi:MULTISPECIES: hypothetical protein [unclassified Microbacterium]|uniref:hypothetical protein n=1 Tax=unclassified Microbacterium TaxID=2609290 RepID=UPI000EA8AE77|nr:MULTISPECIES: hypothetical protein [unclassified Microbacterium]MBT2483934.1 hypothetical protein [Microbacterium sp. ISL-108]RKN66905.1 hypothetical protein D7252_04400 [Microbacterium sp. CGR2]
MTSFRLANELAEVLVPIGYIGAGLAAVCAVVAGIAIIRGAGGLSGGAVGLWIVFALMSFTASFANQWVPVLAACLALVAMLVVGCVVRGVVLANAGRSPERASAATKISAPVATSAARPVLRPAESATGARA